MLEQLMYLAMGFLAGAVVMLAFMPTVHERAVRLTARKLRAATPPSVEEMHVRRDLMRAEYAMKVSRLEAGVEDAKASAVGYRVEIGRKAAEIRELKVELGKATVLLLQLHGRQQGQRNAGRRVARLVLYLFERTRRTRRVPPVPQARIRAVTGWRPAAANS